MADLAAAMRRYPQVLVNVRVLDRALLDDAAEVWAAVEAAEDALGDSGRVLAGPALGHRATGPVMVEAGSEADARAHAGRASLGGRAPGRRPGRRLTGSGATGGYARAVRCTFVPPGRRGPGRTGHLGVGRVTARIRSPMCGIVGYVGPEQALPIIIEGLRRLEYRGYDSAGVALPWTAA